MPIYEYRRADGTTFEIQQKFSDDSLTVDPETGEPVERIYHSPAIHFKGSGFHNTDYSSKRRGKADSDGGPSEAKKETSKSDSGEAKATKSESKPDTKPAKPEKKAKPSDSSSK